MTGLIEETEKREDVSARIDKNLANVIERIAKDLNVSKVEASRKFFEMLSQGKNPVEGALQQAHQVQQLRPIQGIPPTPQAISAQGVVDQLASTVQMRALSSALQEDAMKGGIDFNQYMQYVMIDKLTRPDMMQMIFPVLLAQLTQQQKATGQEVPPYIQNMIDNWRQETQQHKEFIASIMHKLDVKETQEKMAQMQKETTEQLIQLQQQTDANIAALQKASDDKFLKLMENMNRQIEGIKSAQTPNDFASQVSNLADTMKAMNALREVVVETGKQYGLTEKEATAIVTKTTEKLSTADQITNFLLAVAKSLREFRPVLENIMRARRGEPLPPAAPGVPAPPVAPSAQQIPPLELSPEEYVRYELEIKQYGGITPESYQKILAERQKAKKPTYTLKPGEPARPVTYEQPPIPQAPPEPPAPIAEELEKRVEEMEKRIEEKFEERVKEIETLREEEKPPAPPAVEVPPEPEVVHVAVKKEEKSPEAPKEEEPAKPKRGRPTKKEE